MTLPESSRPYPGAPEADRSPSPDRPIPDLPVYVVNIDRAIARMTALTADAERLGLAIERVPGVDGKLLPAEARVDVDEALFFSRNGRVMLGGEYGCYRSHLLAFERFLEGDAAAAVIVEDDVLLDGDLGQRVRAIHAAVPAADVVKLVNHRAGGFRPLAQSALGDRIGRCALGPQGSAAAYLITRAGAARLLAALKVMALPFDVALERGWANGGDIYTTETNIIGFGAQREATMIGTRADYRAVKLAGWRRLPAYLFRLREIVSRLVYARRPLSGQGARP